MTSAVEAVHNTVGADEWCGDATSVVEGNTTVLALVSFDWF